MSRSRSGTTCERGWQVRAEGHPSGLHRRLRPLWAAALGLLLAAAPAAWAQDAKAPASEVPAGLEAEYARAMALLARRVGKSQPWLRRRPIIAADGSIQQGGEQITAADGKGFTVTVVGKGPSRTVQRPWTSLDEEAMKSVLDATMDHKIAEDCLAAGTIALARGQTEAAERHFQAAGKLGADTAKYRAPLAAAAFAEAKELLAKGQFAEAAAAMDALKAGYPKWASQHEQEVRDALAKARAGEATRRVETLLARAAELNKSEHVWDRWDLKLVCDELRTKYAKTELVRNAQGDLATWSQRTNGLGDFILVARGGGGHVKTIGQAIATVRPNSLIQIEDDGPYNEPVAIPKEKPGLLIRGKEGCWPVITSAGERKGIEVLVTLEADHTALDRLLLVHAVAEAKHCVAISSNGCWLRRSVVFMLGDKGLHVGFLNVASIEDALVLAEADMRGSTTIINTVYRGMRTVYDKPTSSYRCTFLRPLTTANGGVFRNCILGDIKPNRPDQTRLVECNLVGTLPKELKPDDSCFREKARFEDAKNLDYTPVKSSLCGKRAVGCQYTEDMHEMRRRVLELVKQGLIKL